MTHATLVAPNGRALTHAEALERLRDTEQRLSAALAEQARLEARIWLLTKGQEA